MVAVAAVNGPNMVSSPNDLSGRGEVLEVPGTVDICHIFISEGNKYPLRPRYSPQCGAHTGQATSVETPPCDLMSTAGPDGLCKWRSWNWPKAPEPVTAARPLPATWWPPTRELRPRVSCRSQPPRPQKGGLSTRRRWLVRTWRRPPPPQLSYSRTSPMAMVTVADGALGAAPAVRLKAANA